MTNPLSENSPSRTRLRYATFVRFFFEQQCIWLSLGSTRFSICLPGWLSNSWVATYSSSQYQQFAQMFYHKIPSGFRYIPWQSVVFVFHRTIPDRNMQGVLLSNETIQITVRAYIDNAMALTLNQGPRDLSATLILHTVLGKDHFISVSGEYS